MEENKRENFFSNSPARKLDNIYIPDHSIIKSFSLKTELNVENILATTFPLLNTRFEMKVRIHSQFMWLNFVLDPELSEFFHPANNEKRNFLSEKTKLLSTFIA